MGLNQRAQDIVVPFPHVSPWLYCVWLDLNGTGVFRVAMWGDLGEIY